MNASTSSQIREACLKAKARGIELKPGPWFDMSRGEVVSCCAIGAVLLANNVPLNPTTDRPGYVKAACELLEVTPQWLYRFWMGFDRGYQIMVTGKDDKEFPDDTSSFGIQLRKELLST